MKTNNEELLLKILKKKWMWISQEEFKRQTDEMYFWVINRNAPPSTYKAWSSKKFWLKINYA